MKVRVNATYTASFVVEVDDNASLHDVLTNVDELPVEVKYPDKYRVELVDWDVARERD